MKLWTLHTPDFSLTEGRIDHTKSGYCRYPSIMATCRELHSRLGTNQIIWCYISRPPNGLKTGVHKKLWSLEVPNDKIICFIDGFVWNRIALRPEDRNILAPAHLENQWKNVAIQKFLNEADRDKYVNDRRSAYWHQEPQTGDWWDELFVSDYSSEGVDVIIPHPIPESWVLDKEEFVSKTHVPLRVRRSN